jgi:hypothetical protein
MSPRREWIFRGYVFQRSDVAMATNVLPGEIRRFGRNPLAKKADVTMATKNLPGENVELYRSIKVIQSF